ncbi:radical SAM protein [Roseospira visakhapatnamensis]|uniref:Putative pyruvate formate lyase activating enzyme n=1 Tax=Roseospira visakhapatnamensis TaxID=390880 RepID=A0A7W6W8N0_9PROT|nr:radical SAM protein [Roseospira visakhapatnamensis]MBB4264557.1 putative pyruvate formate lyase activating enzyme [Roseospira visakhapatnamensis]
MDMTIDADPGYLRLHRRGDLARRAEAAVARLADCDLCPQACHVDRTAGDAGALAAGAVCRTGRHARVASVGPGFAEERVVVGDAGSGDVVFAWCNMRCVYCENADASMRGKGDVLDARALADAMLDLQRAGCPTINLVGPSHVVAQILEALVLAAEDGLSLPLVYNSGGYDSVDTLRLLDGVVDIYTPDAKYADDMAARRCSRVRDYGTVNRAAIAEMIRQVGPLRLDPDTGLARRGVLLRHLVLPDDMGGVRPVLELARALGGPGMTVAILDSYHPAHQADRVPGLAAPADPALVAEARALARALDLEVVDLGSADEAGPRESRAGPNRGAPSPSVSALPSVG